MAKGALLGHAEDADNLPTFLTAGQLSRTQTHIPNRLWTVRLGNPRNDRGSYVVLYRIYDAAGAPLTVTLQNRGVWWVTALNVSNTRAHNLLKRLRDVAWRVATIAQLRADNTAAGVAIKASPDLRKPATREAGTGNVLTWDTEFAHTLSGHDEPSAANNTNTGDIDAGTPEPLALRVRVRPTRARR